MFDQSHILWARTNSLERRERGEGREREGETKEREGREREGETKRYRG